VSWTAADTPDLTGRTAVVTGANGGLGLETARALVGAGASVVMAARNQEKAVAAEAAIRRGAPDARLEVVELDLGSLASVREAATQILATHETIDILVNNAGIMGIPSAKPSTGSRCSSASTTSATSRSPHS
jgi:NAD(P)-dependent dehydrogenase (short-subunit alcohol dehydrogenase family)